ncbi:phage tail protein [Desulfosporosinus sp. OT]|uniref:phage tail protein n=1 Tax=Desulfosporosinus sp. OT TaxID=913865 RepID=UPI000223A5D0|nr:phage tail protein [Desulfosporosinus sp. OT]EGW39157.1 hypothetical protein DOT_2890 [Desulfosporosinus sp. OT]
MPIAVFGSKVFEITDSKLYTLGDMQYGTTLDTEKQDAQGKKPSTYNKGPALNTLGITLKLNVSFGVNPRREMEEWERIKDTGVAYPFILGRSPLGLGNKWLLVDLQASNLVIDNGGNVLAADLQLKFDEYVRPGTAAASASKAGGSKGTVSVPGLAFADYGGVYGPEDKSNYKRENPEMDHWSKITGG